ncbi:MerR family transcriptional regulator [Amycolatopsis alkalitolerans]|uniref:MerR family transcriptional regulator n=1 Tax=Amycolatopsis alkalitolerans TaxID=2547244 RepID=A0A5C4LUF1_9PSEU|nr:MerR family transcriptional regulator [Amycolatopsis alkalitolerans]TNC21070.1 MerR family transcriptional regulator [Amycolatopsis alkalitolerans]
MADETLSIVEVARLAKVTSRTLRHYGDIGLLPPAYTDHSGRRFYRREHLVRLQQILLLRELGLGLDRIGRILSGSVSPAEGLRLHRKWLLAERDRLDRLAATVAKTITELEGGISMNVERMFEGFAPGSEKAERLAKEAAERWGERVTESYERTKKWPKDKWDAVNRQGAEATGKLAELAKAGVPVDDERVLDAVAAHYGWLKNHWTPDAESYAGLGRTYAEDERFRSQYETVHPGFADYLRDAMAAFAAARLTA